MMEEAPKPSREHVLGLIWKDFRDTNGKWPETKGLISRLLPRGGDRKHLQSLSGIVVDGSTVRAEFDALRKSLPEVRDLLEPMPRLLRLAAVRARETPPYNGSGPHPRVDLADFEACWTSREDAHLVARLLKACYGQRRLGGGGRNGDEEIGYFQPGLDNLAYHAVQTWEDIENVETRSEWKEVTRPEGLHREVLQRIHEYVKSNGVWPEPIAFLIECVPKIGYVRRHIDELGLHFTRADFGYSRDDELSLRMRALQVVAPDTLHLVASIAGTLCRIWDESPTERDSVTLEELSSYLPGVSLNELREVMPYLRGEPWWVGGSYPGRRSRTVQWAIRLSKEVEDFRGVTSWERYCEIRATLPHTREDLRVAPETTEERSARFLQQSQEQPERVAAGSLVVRDADNGKPLGSSGPTAVAPPKSIPADVDSLSRALGTYGAAVWVGAGASQAAGYPGTKELLQALDAASDDKLPLDSDFTVVVDAFFDSMGRAALDHVLEQTLGAPLPLTPFHRALAQLVRAGVVRTVLTTNYDDLLERAFSEAGVHVPKQVMDRNWAVSAGTNTPRLIKVHGDRTDWKQVILSGRSYAAFSERYAMLERQLDLLRQQSAFVFVGCSMTDPRLLEWLARLGREARAGLHPWRPMMTEASWQAFLAFRSSGRSSLEAIDGALFRPLILKSHEAVQELWAATASRLAPADTTQRSASISSGVDLPSSSSHGLSDDGWLLAKRLLSLILEDGSRDWYDSEELSPGLDLSPQRFKDALDDLKAEKWIELLHSFLLGGDSPYSIGRVRPTTNLVVKMAESGELDFDLVKDLEAVALAIAKGESLSPEELEAQTGLTRTRLHLAVDLVEGHNIARVSRVMGGDYAFGQVDATSATRRWIRKNVK